MTDRYSESSRVFGEGKDPYGMEGKGKIAFCAEEKAQRLLRRRRMGKDTEKMGRFRMRTYF